MRDPATFWTAFGAIATAAATIVALWFGRRAIRSERSRSKSEQQGIRTALYSAAVALSELEELAEVQMTDAGRPQAQPRIGEILKRESEALRHQIATVGPLSEHERRAALELWDAIARANAALFRSRKDVRATALDVAEHAKKLIGTLAEADKDFPSPTEADK